MRDWLIPACIHQKQQHQPAAPLQPRAGEQWLSRPRQCQVPAEEGTELPDTALWWPACSDKKTLPKLHQLLAPTQIHRGVTSVVGLGLPSACVLEWDSPTPEEVPGQGRGHSRTRPTLRMPSREQCLGHPSPAAKAGKAATGCSHHKVGHFPRALLPGQGCHLLESGCWTNLSSVPRGLLEEI